MNHLHACSLSTLQARDTHVCLDVEQLDDEEVGAIVPESRGNLQRATDEVVGSDFVSCEGVHRQRPNEDMHFCMTTCKEVSALLCVCLVRGIHRPQ